VLEIERCSNAAIKVILYSLCRYWASTQLSSRSPPLWWTVYFQVGQWLAAGPATWLCWCAALLWPLLLIYEARLKHSLVTLRCYGMHYALWQSISSRPLVQSLYPEPSSNSAPRAATSACLIQWRLPVMRSTACVCLWAKCTLWLDYMGKARFCRQQCVTSWSHLAY